MPPRRLDLNLVRVLVAVFEARSVSLAADRLFVSQPTVSYSLGRLRELLDDPLFVRGVDGMQPTDRATRVYAEFRDALGRITATVEDCQGFDPARAEQRFRVSMSDIGQLIFLPPLLALLGREAPGVELEVVQEEVAQIPAALAAGKLDLAVGNLQPIVESTSHLTLFNERYVGLVRSGHPAVADGLSLAGYLAARHVVVSSPFAGHTVLEDALREQGLRRKVTLHIPHFTILPSVIAHSDLLVALPSRVAAWFTRYEPLTAVELPLNLAPFDVRMHWHPRHEHSAAGGWLRGAVQRSLGEL